MPRCSRSAFPGAYIEILCQVLLPRHKKFGALRQRHDTFPPVVRIRRFRPTFVRCARSRVSSSSPGVQRLVCTKVGGLYLFLAAFTPCRVFAAIRIYVGAYDDPVDLQVAITLNSSQQYFLHAMERHQSQSSAGGQALVRLYRGCVLNLCFKLFRERLCRTANCRLFDPLQGVRYI